MDKIYRRRRSISFSKKKCFCDAIDARDLFKAVLHCHRTCRLCRHGTPSQWYRKFFVSMEYFQIKSILGMEAMMALDVKTRMDLLERHGCAMSFEDLLCFMEDERMPISDACFRKILASRNPEAVTIFLRTVDRKDHLSFDLCGMMRCCLEEHPNKISERVHQIFIEHSMVRGLSDCLVLSLRALDRVHIPRCYFHLLDAWKHLVLPKMINLPEYLAHRSENEMSEELVLNIHPQHVLNSVNQKKYFPLHEPIAMTIRYQTPRGYVGSDMGGLTKDFYDLLFRQMRSRMGGRDEDYLLPTSSNVFWHKLWYRLGILLCRAVFYDNLSPRLRLHPVLCYFMKHGYEGTMAHFFKAMEGYEIDYLRHLKSLTTMDHDEYRSFLELQDEPFLPRGQYIRRQLKERYLSPSAQAFIEGYRQTASGIYDADIFSLPLLLSFLHGSRSYSILGDESGSLEKNLVVMVMNNNHLLKQKFLMALEALEIETQEKFFRFWLGSASISRFDLEHRPTLVVTEAVVPGCMQSSTCFHQLKIHPVDTRGDLTDVVMRTLRNQDLNESVGMRMQVE